MPDSGAPSPFHAVAADPAGEVASRRGVASTGYEHPRRRPVHKAKLRAGLTRRRAADVLILLLGPDAYRTLVLERGWSREQWAAWAERSILTELFEPGRH